MPSLKDCIATVKEAAGEELTNDDAMDLLSAVEHRITALRRNDPLISQSQAATKAADDIAEQDRIDALVEKRQRMINVLRKRERVSRRAAHGGDEAAATTAMNVGDQKSANSVDAMGQQKFVAGLAGPMMGELREAGVLSIVRSGDEGTQIALAEELRRVNDKNAKASDNKLAEKAAAIISKYQEMARLMQNKAGAFIGKSPDWFVVQMHDSYKIAHAGARGLGRAFRKGMTAANFKAWADVIHPLLDERTFDEAGVTPGDFNEQREFLHHAWKNLVTGNHLKENGADNWLMGFKGPGNLAKKVSQQRVLHFKDAKSWHEYNKQFGHDPLWESILTGLRSAARNTALMEVYGTNPEAAFAADLKQMQDAAHRSGDLALEKKLGGRKIQAQFDAVSGKLSIPGDPTIAAWADSAKALQTMGKLGFVTISAFSDTALAASTLRFHGVNYLEGFTNQWASIVRGRSKGWQREFADYMGIGIDGMLGHAAAQFNATDGPLGRMTKLMDIYFRANLLSWWTDSQKLGVGLMLSRNLLRSIEKSYDALSPELSRSLGRYGIGAEEWKHIQAQGIAETDGNKFVMAQGIENTKARESLRAYFIDTVNEALTIGGAREHAIRTFNGRAVRGDVLGEAIGMIMQFKSFPITMYTKHMKREFGGRTGSIDGVGLAYYLGGTLAMGYLSMIAKDVLKGKNPRDPSNPRTWVSAMSQGGGLGIYGDFLFGQYNRHGRGLWETALGPTAGTVSDFATLFSDVTDLKAIGGQTSGKTLGNDAFRFAMQNTPVVNAATNIFYTKMALDYLILWHIQEAMNPGWAHRFEARAKKDNAQTYFLGPAQAVQ